MKNSFNHHLSKYRNAYNLKLKDVAFLLKIDQANLSRFESGKTQNSKALQGYHILFGLPEVYPNSLFKIDTEEIVNRCFLLIEQLQELPKSYKNIQRMEGIERLITQLHKDV